MAKKGIVNEIEEVVIPATRASSAAGAQLARQRFYDLNRIPISLRVGSSMAEIIYWGYLGTKWWRNYLHTHSFYEICYAAHGRGTYKMTGRDLPLSPGDVFIAKPGEMHEIISARRQPLGIFFWAFTLVPISSAAREQGSEADQSIDRLMSAFARSNRHVVNIGAGMNRVIELMVDEITRRAPGYSTIINGLTLKLLLDTARAVSDGIESESLVDSAPRREADAIIETATRYLRDNLARPIEVRDVAAQVHLSERHLRRLFSQATGNTILEYLTNLRIDMASQLLLDREMPIKQVARAVGYPDAHYFTTLFGRRTGLTPAVFRRSGGTRFLKPAKP